MGIQDNAKPGTDVMLNSRKQGSRLVRLPKIPSLPSRQQILGLLLEAQKVPGSIIELTFGDPPESYSLTAAKDRPKADCVWALYRGDGPASVLEWSHVSNDSEQIHSLIVNQFPGWLKGKLLPEQQATTDQFDLYPTSNYQTGGFQTTTGNNHPLKVHRSTLEGDLQNMQVPNLLQSIAMGKLTGRLEIKSRSDIANVYFADGVPLHSELRGSEGDNALIELVSWEEGQFNFYPEPKTDKRTINKRLEFLIMEGCTFQDQYQSLLKHGLAMEIFPVRKHSALSEQEFEEIVSKGAPVDIDMQKRFYVAIDNRSPMFEILRSVPLPKVEWVPILFNLISCRLVEFKKQQLQQSGSQSKYALVDWSQAQGVEKLMIRGDTGLYTYPAFLYFVQKEYSRFDRFDRPFSVVIFSVGVRRPDAASDVRAEILEPLPSRAIKAMGESIARIKRHVDLLAHFQIVYYALLLPETNRHQAQGFVARLNEVLQNMTYAEPLEGAVSVTIGVGSLPEDTLDLDELLSLAKPKTLS